MSLDLSLLPDGGVSWLDASGDNADIVLSTRIRLARNLEGFAFTSRARDGERLHGLTSGYCCRAWLTVDETDLAEVVPLFQGPNLPAGDRHRGAAGHDEVQGQCALALLGDLVAGVVVHQSRPVEQPLALPAGKSGEQGHSGELDIEVVLRCGHRGLLGAQWAEADGPSVAE